MRVIARAYGDAPLDREVVGQTDRVAYIANLSGLSSIEREAAKGVGFPRNCVYRFDAALFESLSKAWERGDRGELEALWSSAEPFV
jgi:hypothetical protein